MTPKKRPRFLDSTITRRVQHAFSRSQAYLYRRTAGRVGATFRVGAAFRKPMPVLLLEHTGRTTGRHLTTPLCYVRDGEALIVVASQGGMPEDPQWYRNLRADPNVRVQIGRDAIPVVARTAHGAERAELWSRAVEAYADFESYQSWTDREIPVVVLEPR